MCVSQILDMCTLIMSYTAIVFYIIKLLTVDEEFSECSNKISFVEINGNSCNVELLELQIFRLGMGFRQLLGLGNNYLIS